MSISQSSGTIPSAVRRPGMSSPPGRPQRRFRALRCAPDLPLRDHRYSRRGTATLQGQASSLLLPVPLPYRSVLIQEPGSLQSHPLPGSRKILPQSARPRNRHRSASFEEPNCPRRSSRSSRTPPPSFPYTRNTSKFRTMSPKVFEVFRSHTIRTTASYTTSIRSSFPYAACLVLVWEHSDPWADTCGDDRDHASAHSDL